jgi:DNA adenine methylase
VSRFRPPLRYHGGKALLGPWIISHFAPHRIYTEVFGGGASVLLQKERAYAEIYNDLDKEVVTFFQVLRGPRSKELIERIRLTPFSRCEFFAAYDPTDDPIEIARRLVIRSFMGFGSDGHNGARTTGFRANSNRSGTTPARDWASYPDALPKLVERLRGVVIENRDAFELLEVHDSPETLHYVDPPYMRDLRSRAANSTKKNYRHELTDGDHERLLALIVSLKGMVAISGYASELYDDMLVGWRRFDRSTFADGARARVESLWINPLLCRRMPAPSLMLEVA